MVSSARYPIGVSSYADGTSSSPRGKMQTVISSTLAAQVCSAAFEFDRDVLKWNGEHVTPNEGIRELERQVELYDLYKNHGGALAAVPGTSTHGPQIGTAIDWGVTRADGTNRALTSAEFTSLYAILVRRGIVHTGAHFVPSEAWHVNGGYAQYAAPIPNAPLPGTYTPPKAPTLTYPNDWKTDMKYRLFAHPATESMPDGIKGGYWFQNIESGKKIHVGSPADLALIQRVLRNDGTDQMYQSEIDNVIANYIQKVA